MSSYYFTIIGARDTPLFESEFGTSKSGGDGASRFRAEASRMNRFVAHASLDVADEVQWSTGAMYLKHIDRYQTTYVSAFVTGTGVRFLLLHCPDPLTAFTTTSSTLPPPAASTTNSSGSSSTLATNPTGPAAEEAVRQFFADVYESWVKAAMSPFHAIDAPVRSPMFRARVAAAGRKYL